MVDIAYPLLTTRLTLRRFRAEDLPAYYAYQRLPETAQYLLNEPRSYTECMARIALFADAPFAGVGDWASFAVEATAQPGLIGQISLKWAAGGREGVPGPTERVGEIGWNLAPAAQGHGYATEAARAVLALATGSLGFRRIEARLDARNHASAAVCTRLGMHREAVLQENMYLKGEWTSEAIYALVAPGSGSVAPRAVARNA